MSSDEVISRTRLLDNEVKVCLCVLLLLVGFLSHQLVTYIYVFIIDCYQIVRDYSIKQNL